MPYETQGFFGRYGTYNNAKELGGSQALYKINRRIG